MGINGRKSLKSSRAVRRTFRGPQPCLDRQCWVDTPGGGWGNALPWHRISGPSAACQVPLWGAGQAVDSPVGSDSNCLRLSPHPHVPWGLIPQRPTWRSGSSGLGEPPRVPDSLSGKRRQKVLLALGFAFSALRSEHSTSQFCFLIKL